MVIYDELKNDHRKVIGLLDELLKVRKDDKDRWQSLVQEIRDELVPHSRAEEAVFYNSIRSIEGAKDCVAHSYREHLQAETLLRSLQVMDAFDVNFVSAAKKLKAALEHHIAEEENQLIPRARQVLTPEEAEVMGEVFLKMKPEVRKGSFMQNTLDMLANLMPPRFRDGVRKFTTQVPDSFVDDSAAKKAS